MRHVVIGTAGHIDHGKTLLVKALTGVDADRWEEEKRRGITIDIGFASLMEEGRVLHFVDLPGHEKFIKNMLAGATGVDIFLLVVAADESVMPQTREHTEILRLLGLSRGVVVLNKADLVDAEMLGMARLELADFLGEEGFGGLPVIVASALNGKGVDEVRRALLDAAEACPPRPVSRPFRLPIDRVFPVKGFGTVVTGTCSDGGIGVDERVELYPHGQTSKVRGIQVFQEAVEDISAGQRAALNLPDIHHSEISRGDVAAASASLWPTYLLDVRLEVLSSSPMPLKDGLTALLHLHTQEVEAHLHLAAAARMEPGESGLAQLRLNEKACAWPKDRFILRLPAPARTVAGGEILLPAKRKTRWNRPRDASVAKVLNEKGSLGALEALLLEAGPLGASPPEAAARLGIAQEALEEAASLAERAGELVKWASGGWWLHPLEADQWLARAEGWLGAKASSAAWIPRPEFVAHWGRLLDLRQAEALAQALCASGKAEGEQDRLRPKGHSVVLNEAQRNVWEAILRDLRGGEACVRAGAELERLHGPFVRKALPLMEQQGILLRFGGDFFVTKEALSAIRETLSAHARTSGEVISIPDFKALFNISRRYAMPLLEYLDDLKWTRREGDGRRILP